MSGLKDRIKAALAAALNKDFSIREQSSAQSARLSERAHPISTPVPPISGAQQAPFIRLGDDILAAKTANPAADTSEQEAEIDRMAYALYGLTAEEIEAVQ